MRWIAPASKDTATASLEKRLWSAADELRANSGLTAAQYSQPVLGLIFLRFADAKFAARRSELEKNATGRRGSRVDDASSYHAVGVLFLPTESRFAALLEYPEGGREAGFVFCASTRATKRGRLAAARLHVPSIEAPKSPLRGSRLEHLRAMVTQ